MTSISQIRAKARAEAARIQRRAERAANAAMKDLERKIDARTGCGNRTLSRSEIERLGRELSADLERRMR